MQRLQLTLSAEELKNIGGLRDRISDPYAKVSICGGPLEGTELGQTETIENCLSPHWVKIFYVDVDPSIYMPFLVQIYDENKGPDKLMEEGEFEFTSVYTNQGNSDSCGHIHVVVTESLKGNETGEFTLSLRGLDIKNVERGVLGLGVADPFFEIAKKLTDHSSGVVRWLVVYRSDHIDNNLNPMWKECTIDMESLCYGKSDWPLRISVWDYEKNGKHRIIGSLETTVQGLISRRSVKGNADREQAFEITSQNDAGISESCGLVVVLKAQVS